MKNKAFSYMTAIIAVVLVIFTMTMLINGKNKNVENKLSALHTGRDILVCSKEKNELIDVEQYVAAVLPGEVEPNLSSEMLEAQAVAVRTKIYFAMGEKTVIDAKEFSYKFYDDDAYINRWGKENYQSIKRIYEQAVINTAGKIIK